MIDTPISIKAATMGMNLAAHAGLTPTHVNLKSPDSSINLKLPVDKFPFILSGDMVTVFISVVRVGAGDPPADPGFISPPGLVLPH